MVRRFHFGLLSLSNKTARQPSLKSLLRTWWATSRYSILKQSASHDNASLSDFQAGRWYPIQRLGGLQSPFTSILLEFLINVFNGCCSEASFKSWQKFIEFRLTVWRVWWEAVKSSLHLIMSLAHDLPKVTKLRASNVVACKSNFLHVESFYACSDKSKVDTQVIVAEFWEKVAWTRLEPALFTYAIAVSSIENDVRSVTTRYFPGIL